VQRRKAQRNTIAAGLSSERRGGFHVKYYSVAEMEITDRSWVPEYVKNVTRMVEQRGGRFLARTSKVEKIEGERKRPQIFLRK
jgi:hypothetical protein